MEFMASKVYVLCNYFNFEMVHFEDDRGFFSSAVLDFIYQFRIQIIRTVWGEALDLFGADGGCRPDGVLRRRMVWMQ